jgi:ZIP family zinc transporter
MNMTLLILALATFTSTYLGGRFALRFRDRSHLIVGFSAGAVIGLAFFDLLPEAISLSIGNVNTGLICSIIAFGFLAYMMVDRIFGVHSHGDLHETEEHDHSEHEKRGSLRAGSLSFHSLLDGLGIGLAFQASPTVGIVVAIAVLGHDFCDGINTVTSVIKGGGDRSRALRWLFIDAFAPVLGIFLTFFFSVPEKFLGLILALFAGFFLYIGACDLVPESYHAHPTWKTTVATIFGALFILLVVTIAG